MVLIPVVSAEIIINEVMYNPVGTDEGREWVELYNSGNNTVDLEGWKFYEGDANHGLFLYQGSYSVLAGGYVIIVDDIDEFFEDYPDFNGVILDSSWSSLSNDGETIAIKNSSLHIIDEITYSDDYGDGNNKSIEFYQGSWYDSFENMGTPGRENRVVAENKSECDLDVEIHTDKIIFDNSEEFGFKIIVKKQISNETNIIIFREILNEFGEVIKSYSDLSTTINRKKTISYSSNMDYGTYLIRTNITYSSCIDFNLSNNYYEKLVLIRPPVLENSPVVSYSSVSINEFYPNPEGDDNAPMPSGEFIEIYSTEDLDMYGSYFEDAANHKVYVTDTTTIDGTFIEAGGYLAIYMNGFSGFLNNEGLEEIRFYDPYGNLIDSMNYADSREALSWSLVGGAWQYRLPSPNEMNDLDEPEAESYFKIESIKDLGSDNMAEFGDIIKIKFNVYKGDTTKSSIKLYIEDDENRITKITKVNLHNKFTNYSLTVPIPLYSNCNQKYGDGDYHVKLGWTSSSIAEDSYKIRVEGIEMDNCDEIYIERKSITGTLAYQLIEYPLTVKINQDFIVKVRLTNEGADGYPVAIWSYVYRGSKTYSGDRGDNKKAFYLDGNSALTVELRNIVLDADPGEYKLKVLINKDEQKTNKQLIEDINVIGIQTKEEVQVVLVKDSEFLEEAQIQPLLYPNYVRYKEPYLVYESNDFKAKNMITSFLIILLGMFVVYLILKKE